MEKCTCCKEEAEKTAKIRFSTLDGEEIKINICEKCANRIDEDLSCLIVCRNCRTVIWRENAEEEKVSIKVQNECSVCAEPAKGAITLPMV